MKLLLQVIAVMALFHSSHYDLALRFLRVVQLALQILTHLQFLCVKRTAKQMTFSVTLAV